MRPRRLFAYGLAAAALLAVLVPGASAAELTRKKSLWGPATPAAFDAYRDLGAGIYQTSLTWRDAAPARPARPADPSDPAYRWPAHLDVAAGLAQERGIALSLLVMRTPAWANGGNRGRWAPRDPRDFARFMTAAARRYPAVRHWMIWGEPTKRSNFRARRPARKYARMLDASYAALKRVNRGNLVIGGNSYTVGNLTPRRWIRSLRLPEGRPPRMDLYGHNPFTARRPVLSQDPLGGGLADFGDLDTLTRWLDRRYGRTLKLFLSETSFPTDHENHEFNFWMTRAAQARWIADALRVTRSWSRIYTFGYLGLYDDELRPDGRQVERGLLERDGSPKPAYEAFRRG